MTERRSNPDDPQSRFEGGEPLPRLYEPLSPSEKRRVIRQALKAPRRLKKALEAQRRKKETPGKDGGSRS